MKLLLTTDAGEVLDGLDISREDWDALSPVGAWALINDLTPGGESGR